MKALRIVEAGKLEIVEVSKPELEAGKALVKINAAALNRRDQWIREGKYPNIQMHTTLGSDGAGEVVEVSSDKDNNWIGKKVVINPNLNWGDNPLYQSKEYSVLGMPGHGTFAEYIAVDIDRLAEQPGHLNDTQAAALPLGGLTAFRAVMKQGNLQANQKILISGFGGGVAQFAFQFAMAIGADVYVTSGSNDKLETAVEMGAKGGFNYKLDHWHKDALKATGGFDVIIDSAGGDQVNTLIKITKPAGKMVFYGATNGAPANLDMFRMFWNQITLQGTTMGNDEEFVEMIEFVNQHKLVPIVDTVRTFEHAIDAFDQMATGNRIGKLVVRMH